MGKVKQLVERLPLEESAVACAAGHLPSLTPTLFAQLLQELASDNHAYRFVSPHTLIKFEGLHTPTPRTSPCLSTRIAL